MNGMLKLVAFAGLALVSTNTAWAQSPQEFYDKTDITMVVGFNAGGAYDLYARTLARHMGKHLPGNPNIIIENMPGGGSVIAANHLFNRSAKDGSEIGLLSGSVALDPLFKVVPTEFDSRTFTWLGSAEESVGVCLVRDTSSVKSAQDLFDKELIVAAAGTDTRTVPAALNSILGTRIQIISGYQGSAGMMLALEQGEVDGACGMIYAAALSQRPDWFKSGFVRPILQFGFRKSEALSDVPAASDFATTEEQRQLLQLVVGWTVMGRPFVAPPGIPSDRAEVLRQAFEATMSDPEFIADAQMQRLDVSPSTVAEIEEFLDNAYDTPQSLVDQVAKLIADGQ